MQQSFSRVSRTHNPGEEHAHKCKTCNHETCAPARGVQFPSSSTRMHDAFEAVQTAVLVLWAPFGHKHFADTLMNNVPMANLR